MIDSMSFAGVTLHENDTRSVAEVVGLLGVPSVRGEAVDRADSDGGIERGESRLSPRIVTIRGEVWGGTAESVLADFDLILGALRGSLAAGSMLEWQRGNGGPLLRGVGRLSGEVSAPVIGGGARRVAYEATLRFADPTWYSTSQFSVSFLPPSGGGGLPLPITFPIPFVAGGGGSAIVVNAGAAATWPRFVISGPMIAPVILNSATGKGVSFPGLTLLAGQQLTVEMAPSGRGAWMDGVSAAQHVRWSDATFFSCPPGSTVVQVFGAGGGYGPGTVTDVFWRNAY